MDCTEMHYKKHGKWKFFNIQQLLKGILKVLPRKEVRISVGCPAETPPLRSASPVETRSAPCPGQAAAPSLSVLCSNSESNKIKYPKSRVVNPRPSPTHKLCSNMNIGCVVWVYHKVVVFCCVHSLQGEFKTRLN